MEPIFWKTAFFIIFAIILIVKVYQYFAPPKLEDIYLELLSPDKWKLGILLKYEAKQRSKMVLDFNTHHSLLSQMKDKGLLEERYTKTKNRKFKGPPFMKFIELPLRQYKLTEKGVLSRSVLLRESAQY